MYTTARRGGFDLSDRYPAPFCTLPSLAASAESALPCRCLVLSTTLYLTLSPGLSIASAPAPAPARPRPRVPPCPCAFCSHTGSVTAVNTPGVGHPILQPAEPSQPLLLCPVPTALLSLAGQTAPSASSKSHRLLFVVLLFSLPLTPHYLRSGLCNLGIACIDCCTMISPHCTALHSTMHNTPAVDDVGSRTRHPGTCLFVVLAHRQCRIVHAL